MPYIICLTKVVEQAKTDYKINNVNTKTKKQLTHGIDYWP